MNYSTMTEAEREASHAEYETKLAAERLEKKRKWNLVKGKLTSALTSLGLVVDVRDDEWGTGGHINAIFCEAKSLVSDSTYLSIVYDRYGAKGRVTVNVSARDGAYQHMYHHGEERVSISFDGSKTAEAMALDIKRRILLHFQTVIARTSKRIEYANMRETTKITVLRQLKGSALDEYETRNGKVRLDITDGYGDVSYYDETHASIDLHGIALDKVLRILAIVREA
jgi:hypothetical protein